MLGKFIKGLRGETEAPRPAVVGQATLGRALRIDPSMLGAMEHATGEAVSPDFVITGQGLVEMADGAGTTWLHRFYDDEHRMLQAMTDSSEGGDALEWSFYVPAGATYPGPGQTERNLRESLMQDSFAHGGESFGRLWYDGEPGEQAPVEFAETVFETGDMADARALEQACMVYGRDTPKGELLLLVILMGHGADASLERMLGTGLRPHQIGV